MHFQFSKYFNLILYILEVLMGKNLQLEYILIKIVEYTHDKKNITNSIRFKVFKQDQQTYVLRGGFPSSTMGALYC